MGPSAPGRQWTSSPDRLLGERLTSVPCRWSPRGSIGGLEYTKLHDLTPPKVQMITSCAENSSGQWRRVIIYEEKSGARDVKAEEPRNTKPDSPSLNKALSYFLNIS